MFSVFITGMDVFSVILLAHLAGAIVSVGGATMSDALFFKSVKNRHISGDEYKLLHEAGKVIWSGFTLAILSGIGLLVYQYVVGGEVTYWNNAFFQAKLVITCAILVNGVVFHTKVLPLIKNHLGDDMREEELSEKFWLFALTGAISIVSWWSVILLAGLRPDFPVLFILNIYLLIIAFGSLFGYLMLTHVIFDKKEKDSNQKKEEKTKAFVWTAVAIISWIVLLIGSIYIWIS